MMEVQVMCEKKSGYRDFFLCPECGYTRSRFVKVVPDV
jgi:rubredoxin